MLAASVVIVAWNGARHLPLCLDAVVHQSMPPEEYEVLVVDNASSDGSADLVRGQFPSVRLIEAGTNLGYAGGGNLGWRTGSGKVLALLNQDTVPQPQWLASLAVSLEDRTVGVAGSKILEPDGITIQHAGGYLEWPAVQGFHDGRGEADAGQHDQVRDVEYVTGAALAVRRDLVNEIGFMDEGFFPGYFEDADLCLRARRAGYRVTYVPEAVVLHHESTSFGQSFPGKGPSVHCSRLRFILKHYSPEQIVGEFVPAEIARLPGLCEEELRSVSVACTQAQISWPSLVRAHHPGLAHADALRVVSALRLLHNAVIRQELRMLGRADQETR